MSWFEQNIDLWGEDIPWLSGVREKGMQAFKNVGMPNNKTEAWRFDYFKATELEGIKINTEPHECHCGGNCGCHKHALPFDAYEIKLCDGKPDVAHLNLPNGLIVKTLAEAIFDKEAQKYIGKSFEYEKFPFAALNTAYLEQGLFILLEKGIKLEKPLCLHYRTHGENQWQNVRNIIVAESDSEIVFIEDFKGKSGKYFNNIVNEIFVGANAKITHYTKINESADALHISLNSVNVRQDGCYESFCALAENRLTRQETLIKLQHCGAKANCDGIYRLHNNGVSSIATNVRHLAPQTCSNQVVKGVLDGKSKGVFQGQIHIAPNAQKVVGNQLHRALLLSDNAEVDCKPELEIFADDVKCSHGATSGDLDEEQLFYLQSRGIEYEAARQILINAYLAEVLQKIEDENIRDWLAETV